MVVSTLLIALFFTGCKEKPKKLSPIQTKIEGNMGEYFTVVEEEYSYPEVSNGFTFEVERTDKALPNFNKAGIGIEFFDKNGKSIAVQKAKLEALTAFGSFPLSLVELSENETGYVNINLKDWPDGYDGAKTFKITIESNMDKTEQTSGKTNNVSSKNDSNEWDSVLDDYEKFVDKYIKLFKKAQNGDTSAITEYAECLEKAQSLQEKLENAKSNLTSKQVSRLTKIINKLSNAVTSAL